MKGFIEEFYFGNLEPQARSFTQNAEVASQTEILAENETFLTKNLADEEKSDFSNTSTHGLPSMPNRLSTAS